MGKIIEPGIGMELSCNRRLLERILGDFLSQWVADFFFFLSFFKLVSPIYTENPLSVYKADKEDLLWWKQTQPRAWYAQLLMVALQTSPMPWPLWGAHSECY